MFGVPIIKQKIIKFKLDLELCYLTYLLDRYKLASYFYN